MEIAMYPVISSQIEAVGYAPESKTLSIRFKGHNGKEGALYHYSGVPQSMFENMMTAESAGKFFGEFIKPHADIFPYKKQE